MNKEELIKVVDDLNYDDFMELHHRIREKMRAYEHQERIEIEAARRQEESAEDREIFNKFNNEKEDLTKKISEILDKYLGKKFIITHNGLKFEYVVHIMLQDFDAYGEFLNLVGATEGEKWLADEIEINYVAEDVLGMDESVDNLSHQARKEFSKLYNDHVSEYSLYGSICVDGNDYHFDDLIENLLHDIEKSYPQEYLE